MIANPFVIENAYCRYFVTSFIIFIEKQFVRTQHDYIYIYIYIYWSFIKSASGRYFVTSFSLWNAPTADVLLHLLWYFHNKHVFVKHMIVWILFYKKRLRPISCYLFYVSIQISIRKNMLIYIYISFCIKNACDRYFVTSFMIRS